MVLTAVEPLCGQDNPPPIEPGLRARFGFLDPIIQKIGNGTNMLKTVRWSKGGRLHVLVNNPFRARLENLKVEAGRATSDSIPTDGDLSGIASADVDGDGQQDLLMVTARGRLVTRLSDRKAKAIPEIEVGRGQIYDCLRVVDLDGDQAIDAVVLTRDGLRTVTGLGADPKLHPTVPVFARNLRSFCVTDVNGDRRPDVVLCANGSSMQVHIKLGDGKGGFGPWMILESRPLLSVFPGTGVDGASLAAIQVQPRRVVEYALTRDPAAQRPALLLTALEPSSETRPFAQGDLDNDGDLDLVLADPKTAKLIFLLEDQGRFLVEHAPTLAGIRSIAIGDADGDGKQDLILASSEEQAVSWVPGSGPRSAFPIPLAGLPTIADKPAIPVAAGLAGDEVLALLRNRSQISGLYRWKRGAAGTASTFESVLELGKLRRDPKRLLIADLDGQHGPDVAFVLPNEGLKVLFRQEDGGYGAPQAVSEAGFTKRMEDAALSLTGSGVTRALMAVRERYTRRFRFDPSGQPKILDQDNGPEGDATLHMGAILANGTRVLLDRQANRLFRLSSGRPPVSVTLPKIGPTYLLAHGEDAVVLGRQGVLRVPFGQGYRLEVKRQHEPPTTKTRYYAGIAADLDGDGTRDLVLADDAIHGIHILVAEGDRLRRGLSFPVFETSGSGTGEPRAMAAGDVNSDGRDDLLLLAHDRILIYFQER